MFPNRNNNYSTITTTTMNHFINTRPPALATVLFHSERYEVLQDVNHCYYLRGLGWVDKQLCETVPIVYYTLAANQPEPLAGPAASPPSKNEVTPIMIRA